MTEQLATLMHDEASGLTVPNPPAAAILAQGRRLRRRTRLTVVASSLAVAVVVAGLGSLALDGSEPTREDTVTSQLAFEQLGAWSVGTRLYYGDATVDFEEKIKSLYYTSAGVLVRTGEEVFLDDGGPSHYALVRPDGTRSAIDLDLGDRMPSTEPSSPNFAYAEAGEGGAWEIVVRDVDRDVEVARVEFAAPFTWGGWEAPPVTLHGDVVYVFADDAVHAVNWRKVEVTDAPYLDGSRISEIGARHFVDENDQGSEDGSSWTRSLNVRRLDTGESVLRLPPAEDFVFPTFSPDGHLLLLTTIGMAEGPQTLSVHDLLNGGATEFDPGFRGDASNFGWTPDGHLILFDSEARTLRVCEAMTGSCGEPVKVGKGTVKLGGRSYES